MSTDVKTWPSSPCGKNIYIYIYIYHCRWSDTYAPPNVNCRNNEVFELVYTEGVGLNLYSHTKKKKNERNFEKS